MDKIMTATHMAIWIPDSDLHQYFTMNNYVPVNREGREIIAKDNK